MSYRLEENSWQELASRCKACDVAIIPVGSVEQHGYHLPLGTDTYVAKFLGEEAAEKTGAVVTPPLWFGWSPHHMALAGTITIRPEVLIELLYDVIASLNIHGYRKFVLINGHRIVNISWMQITAQRAQEKLGVTVKIFDPAYMSKDLIESLGFGAVGHSEEIETSHMMHMLPDQVHLEKAVDNPICPDELYSVDPRFPHDTLCYVPSTTAHIRHTGEVAGGTAGSPSKSDAAKGKIYHNHLVANLVRVIEKLKAC